MEIGEIFDEKLAKFNMVEKLTDFGKIFAQKILDKFYGKNAIRSKNIYLISKD